jgi:hypothetical protein
MPERCWFAALPDAGACEGRLVRCHLIPRNKLALEFPHGAAWLPDGAARQVPDDLRDLGPSGSFMPLRGLQDDPRCWVYGCGGAMGPGGHHGRFKPDGPLPIPRRLLPAGLEEFAAELVLGWWLDRTYGEVDG